jgi:ABC-2 type transport system permease protein
VNARVRAVVHKEFKEYRRNKMILLTAMVMPLVFLALPLASTLPLSAAAPHHEIVAVVGTAMLLFLVVPVMIPTTIAAYSIIGEREQGTLEPLLTTTVTDRELLLGKALAAIAPAISIAWMLYGAYTLVVRLFASPPVAREIWSVHWLVAQLLVTPALSVLAILVGMVISVRSNDIRVAQQFSALALVPVLVGVALVTNQVVAPTVTLFVYAALVLAVVDRFLWRAVNRLFDRERLITRFG